MPIRTAPTSKTGLRPRAFALLLCLAAASCVTVDSETNEVVPRGGQRYRFDVVKGYADDLEVGMSKLQVLTTVGSPAEKSARGDRWIYLPERPAILIPSQALQVDFVDDRLDSFGFRAIVLGQKL